MTRFICFLVVCSFLAGLQAESPEEEPSRWHPGKTYPRADHHTGSEEEKEDELNDDINEIEDSLERMEHDVTRMKKGKKKIDQAEEALIASLKEIKAMIDTVNANKWNTNKRTFFQMIHDSSLLPPVKACGPEEVCLPVLECKKTLQSRCPHEILERVCEDDGLGNVKVCCEKGSACGTPRVMPGSADTGFSPVPLGKYPWMAAVKWENAKNGKTLLFGASIVNSRYVITTADAVNDLLWNMFRGYDLKSVIVGARNLSAAHECASASSPEGGHEEKCFSQRVIAIDEVIRHPHASRYGNDMALIRLSESLDFSDPSVLAEPICLSGTDMSKIGVPGIITGWRTEFIVDPVMGLDIYNPGSILTAEEASFDEVPECRTKYPTDSGFYWEKEICLTSQPRGETSKNSYHYQGGQLIVEPRPGHQQFTLAGMWGMSSHDPPTGVYFQRFTVLSGYLDWIVENVMP